MRKVFKGENTVFRIGIYCLLLNSDKYHFKETSQILCVKAENHETLRSKGKGHFFDSLMSAHFDIQIQCSVYHTAPVDKMINKQIETPQLVVLP